MNSASFLSDCELLQILLRCGTKNESVNELSNKLLKEAGSLKNLSEFGYHKLSNIKGIKESKACLLLSAFEIAKRINSSDNKFKLINSRDIYDFFKDEFINVKQEVFYVLLFDIKMNLISKKRMFIGTVDNVEVHPREIFKYAILESASFIVVMHNHPSGDTTPSKNDIDITKQLLKASEIIGIKFIDHIIISSNSYYSFYEEAFKDK